MLRFGPVTTAPHPEASSPPPSRREPTRHRTDPVGSPWRRRSGWWLAGVASLTLVAASLWLIGPQLSRPFVYDDVSFALGARAIAATGLPFGNQGYLLHLYWQRDQWALWHPPLYIYLLGGTVALFGENEPAARSLGVLSLLIAAAFTFDLARRAVREHGGEPESGLAAGVLAVALLVLNPLAIQATLVLDIDNTVLMVLVTAFVWLAIRLPERWGLRTVVGLSVLFAVCLWAKLTTPLALGVALVFSACSRVGAGARAGAAPRRPLPSALWARSSSS